MSSIKLVLLGFLRHVITAIGVWLVAKGYLESETVDSWASAAVEEAFGAIVLAAGLLWSAIDKHQVIGWIRKALHMVPPGGSETAAARRISSLVTSPGTTKVPS